MSLRKPFAVFMTAALLLAACASATPAPTVAPTLAQAPTLAATATTTTASTATAAATGTAAATATPAATAAPSATAVAASPTAAPATTSAPVATTAASDLTDANHARLRVALFDKDGPGTDFLVNGAVAVNAGQPQINIPPGYTTAYLFLAPGTYSVTLALTGQGLAQALVPPVDVAMVAGHRYTMLLMGQIANKSIKSLVIDETAEEQKVGATAADNVTIIANNLVGAAGIDSSWGKKLINGNVPYGGFAAGMYAPGNFQANVIVTGDPKTPLIDEPNWQEPGIDWILGFGGQYPGQPDTDWTVFNGTTSSDLGPIPFLQGFSGKKLTIGDSPASFDTLLAAIKTAGLTDLYTNGGPLMLFAPTDAAFADMDKDKRAALLADKAALTKFLRAHTVAGYIPHGGFSPTPGGISHRTLTSLDGGLITIGENFTMNGSHLGDFPTYFVANGSIVQPVNAVLLP